jgi:hypothetical protein
MPLVNESIPPRCVRCAIYTRKSTEEGLEQPFNTLDVQREAGEAFIRSQQPEDWSLTFSHDNVPYYLPPRNAHTSKKCLLGGTMK